MAPKSGSSREAQAGDASSPARTASRRALKGRLNLPPGTGKAGEAAAAAFLRAQGYDVIVTNFRTQRGEVDILARYGETHVFVEVKSARSTASPFGPPEGWLTAAKQRRLVMAAQAYLAEHSLENADWRIDAVVVVLGGAGRLVRAELFKGAVEG